MTSEECNDYWYSLDYKAASALLLEAGELATELDSRRYFKILRARKPEDITMSLPEWCVRIVSRHRKLTHNIPTNSDKDSELVG